MEYDIYFVVNDNGLTKNPSDGQAFDGPWLQRGGYQVNDPKYATPYYTRKGAQALINKLNRDGITCPQWARTHTNNEREAGRYRIVSGTVSIES